MDITTLVESTVRNLRYAVRALAKAPAFTITVVLTLALGIGANAAVFSAIDAVLLRPLPFRNGDELVRINQSYPGSSDILVAPARLEDWNRLNSTFAAITGYYAEDASETTGELPEKLRRAWVARRFLQVLGVTPAIGRDFTAEEQRFGGPNAVLISDRFWRRRFGGKPDAIGKMLRVPDRTFTIVGIMPLSFQFFDRDIDLWSPSPPDVPYAQARDSTWFNVIARLKPGVTLEQGNADLAAVQSSLGRQYPKTDGKLTTAITPLKEARVHGVRQSLWLLFASVSLLLLIACANIAALLLSRAASREHENSVRFSLGASRVAVAVQLFAEVFILAVAGALTGLLIAAGASRVFSVLAKDLPRIDEIHLNWIIVFYSLGAALPVTLLCGIVPVVRGTRRNPAEALAHGGRSQVSSGNRLQRLLVLVQIALAVILLASAGLLLRSFQKLGKVNAGFDAKNVLTFHISSSWAEAGGKPAKQRTDRILEGLRSLPGVETATISMNLPGVPGEYEIEMKTTEARAESEEKIVAQSRWVTPEYFGTLRIPLMAGELCRDDFSPATVMVNRSFADRYLNGTAAIGRHLSTPNPYILPAEIRGIVGDAREIGMDRNAPPTAYWCSGSMQPGIFFLIRTQGELSSMAESIRQKIHELEPLRSVYGLMPLTEHISDGYAENRLRMILLGFFAFTAITLAALGLYGTLSHLVIVRRREVALRVALGARRIGVVGRFLNQGLRISILGCIAGLASAIAWTRFLSSMLYGVSATDAPTMGTVVAVVLAISAIASLLPAIRAARIEPIQILREE